MKKIFLILFAVIGISAVANAQWGYYYTPTYYPTYTPTYYPTYTPTYYPTYSSYNSSYISIPYELTPQGYLEATNSSYEQYEYNEYLNFKNSIGYDISYDEYKNIRAQALSSEEVQAIFKEQQKEFKKQEKERRIQSEKDRKERINRFKEDSKRRANNYEGPKFGL